MMAYVQGFKLNLLWTSCVKYVFSGMYKLHTLYVLRIYVSIQRFIVYRHLVTH